MLELQVQEVGSGKKIRGKVWMNFESTLRGSEFSNVLTRAIISGGNTVSTAISKTHFGPVMILKCVTW